MPPERVSPTIRPLTPVPAQLRNLDAVVIAADGPPLAVDRSLHDCMQACRNTKGTTEGTVKVLVTKGTVATARQCPACGSKNVSLLLDLTDDDDSSPPSCLLQ